METKLENVTFLLPLNGAEVVGLLANSNAFPLTAELRTPLYFTELSEPFLGSCSVTDDNVLLNPSSLPL